MTVDWVIHHHVCAALADLIKSCIDGNGELKAPTQEAVAQAKYVIPFYLVRAEVAK